MAYVEPPNNRAAPSNDIRNPVIDRSAISERTHGILLRQLP